MAKKPTNGKPTAKQPADGAKTTEEIMDSVPASERTDFARVIYAARELAAEGWATSIAAVWDASAARRQTGSQRMPLRAAERWEFAVPISARDQCARSTRIGGDRPLPIFVSGNAERAVKALQDQGLAAWHVGGDGGVIYVWSAPPQTEQPEPIDWSAGGPLALVNATTGGTIAARLPLRLMFARDLASGAVEWWEAEIGIEDLFAAVRAHLSHRVDESRAAAPEPEPAADGVAHFDQHVEAKQAEAAAPAKRKGGRPKKEQPPAGETGRCPNCGGELSEPNAEGDGPCHRFVSAAEREKGEAAQVEESQAAPPDQPTTQEAEKQPKAAKPRSRQKAATAAA